MKQKSLRTSVVGGVLVSVMFSILFIHFSFAQTVSLSSSSTPDKTSGTVATSTPVQSDDSNVSSTTSAISVQLSSPSSTSFSSGIALSSSSPALTSTSSDATSSSTPIDITQSDSSTVSVTSSTPTVMESATSTPDSSSNTDLISTPTQSVVSADSSTTDVTLAQSSSSPLESFSSSSTSLSLSSASTTTSSTVTQAPLPPAPTPTGYATCDQSVKNVPGDYPTIQAAIDATSFGDTVRIAAGTYNENLTLKSGICIEGAEIDQTIISKSGASGITGNGVSYVIVKDLTVKNSGCAPGVCGGGGNGGGIQLSQSNNITLQSCRLTGNVAVDGGGMSVSQSSVTMDHSLIDSNTANNVGAGMVADTNSTVALTNVTVTKNNWVNPLGNGGVGGIRSQGSGLRIANSILWGNNTQNLFSDASQVSNSDIGGWSGGTNNTASDPRFVSATDYRLQVTSSSVMGMGLY